MTRRLIILSILLLVISCNGSQNENARSENSEDQILSADELIRLNREMVNQDVERNVHFAQSSNWEYTLQDNGLIFEFIRDSIGQPAQAGDKVYLDYRMTDLGNKEIYSANRSGHLLSFVVSYENMEAGINEMVMKMSTGDSVRCILPPHLAFGMTGDGDRVAPRTSIVYYLKLSRIDRR